MLNCGTTYKIKGGLFPNLAFNIETRLNHFRPVNEMTLSKYPRKHLKVLRKACSSNLSDNEPQSRSRDMSRDYFSSKSHFLSQIWQVVIPLNV